MNPRMYLEMIQLQLSYNKTNLNRHFVDQWFCTEHGYVSKSGNPNWEKIIGNEYVSEGYLNLIKDNKLEDIKKDIVHKEHIVPLNEINRMLLECDNSIESIKSILTKYVRFATITKEEDKILNENKLTSVMPDEYYSSTSELHGDIFARYKKIGVNLTKNN